MKVMLALLKEFWQFIKEKKVWWITPIVIIMILLSIFILLTEHSALMPFFYAIF